MSKRKTTKHKEEGVMGLGGFLGGLGSLLEKLGDLAEKGEDLRESGEIHGTGSEKKIQGVYGFSIKVGLGEQGVKVEPFGNVRKDEHTGKTVVDEIREPLADVFEEADHVLVVIEMPGIAEEDIQTELKDDVLIVNAAHGIKKYRKEVLLPATFSLEKMSRVCRNGVLEVRFAR